MKAVLLLAVAFVPMLVEARRSRRNEAALRQRGAIEPTDDVYRQMLVAYPVSFGAMIAEGATRPPADARWLTAGVALFLGAKSIKYWAIAALGRRWTFRVLVPPDDPPVTTGPYRWLRHPNYVGVAGEVGGLALMANAPVTGTLACVLFGALLLARIRVEERALGLDRHVR